MKRYLNILRWDFLLQWRYKLIAAGIFITAFYTVLLKQLPITALKTITPLIFFTDTAIIGFYFLGALIFFERSENTLEGLMVTPLKIKEYFISKIITLTVLALLMSLIITLFSYKDNLNIFLLITGISLMSCFYILIGFIAVVTVNSFSVYIMSSLIYFLALFIPLFDYFGIVNHWTMYLFPTQPCLLLLKAGFSSIKPWQTIYAIVYLTIWIYVMAIIAYKIFYTKIIVKADKLS